MADTCGPLFTQVFQQGLINKGDSPLYFFSLGHMTGQAEKVWMGACAAFMMRPPQEELSNLLERVKVICDVYGLWWDTLETSRGTEVWVTKREQIWIIKTLQATREDSEQWHFIRGAVCGIPPEKIDPSFHKRYESHAQGGA